MTSWVPPGCNGTSFPDASSTLASVHNAAIIGEPGKMLLGQQDHRQKNKDRPEREEHKTTLVSIDLLLDHACIKPLTTRAILVTDGTCPQIVPAKEPRQ
eukprot:1197143-Amphidinium_carterae.1